MERRELREEQAANYEKHVEARTLLKTSRETFKERLLAKVEDTRVEYKNSLQDAMDKRLEYRDIIVSRKERENYLE